MSAGTLATWIAVAFALLSAWAGWNARQQVSRRAMTMCAAFAGVATMLMLLALWRADFSLAFVARHVVLSDGRVTRLFALFSDPAGAGLIGAVCVAGSALLADRNGWLPSGPGMAGVIVLVLLAAPLSAGALSTLAFLPADGAASARFFSHPLALIAALAVMLLLSLASVAFVAAIGGADATRAPLSRLVAAAVLASGVSGLAWVGAGAAVGALREVDPLLARGSQWAALLMVWVMVAFHLLERRPASVEALLGGVLGAIAAVLGSGTTDDGPMASRVLLSLALALLAVASRRDGPRVQGAVARVSHPAGVLPAIAVVALLWVPSGMTMAALLAAVVLAHVVPLIGWASLSYERRLLTMSVVLLATAAAAGRTGIDRELTVAPGSTLDASGVVIAHQGVSTYEAGSATVLSLSLEATPGGAFSRAEQREDVDARGAVLRPVWYVPARFPTSLAARHVWLERVDAQERATVRIVTRPLAWLWGLALLPLLHLAIRPQPGARDA